MAQATTTDAPTRALREVPGEVLQAGLEIVHTARDEAGKWLRKVEDGAEELREHVQGLEVPKLPATIEETYREGSEQAAKTAEAWKSRAGEAWELVQKQLRVAGARLEQGIEPLIHGAGIASRRDMGRLEKKLERLARRVRSLEKRR